MLDVKSNLKAHAQKKALDLMKLNLLSLQTNAGSFKWFLNQLTFNRSDLLTKHFKRILIPSSLDSEAHLKEFRFRTSLTWRGPKIQGPFKGDLGCIQGYMGFRVQGSGVIKIGVPFWGPQNED